MNDNWPIKKQENIKVIIVKPKDSGLWKLCEELEYNTFRECDYVPKSPSKRIKDFDVYSPMEFLVAFVGDNKNYDERRIAGVVRLVYSPHAKKMDEGLFPTIDHAKELNIYPEKLEELMKMDPRTFIDISTMSISKDKRDAKASKALITGIMMHGWEQPRLKYALAAIDTPFYEKLKERHLPFEDIGPSTMYWGSMTTPTFINASKIPTGIEKIVIPYQKIKAYTKLFLNYLKND
jgi:hypothetical protein